MEIERKFLVAQLPDNLDNYNCRYIEQGYLSTKPDVIMMIIILLTKAVV